MANSLDTKKAIRQEITRLTNNKRALQKMLAPAKSRYDKVKDRIAEITASIDKLQLDLDA